jgi:opacity protein-like surface antigen
MQIRSTYLASFLAVFFVLGSAAGSAQTDVAASLYGAFTGTTSSSGIRQSPSNAAGGLIELRHISKPYIGYEATYSYNRANQSYLPLVVPAACPVGATSCYVNPTSVKANANEVTADWVASVKLANLRPFALAGGGLLFNVPASGQTSTSNATKPVFVYGAGLDWGLLPHLGLRLQYRGNLYNAPNLTKLYTSVDKFTQTGEPMIGIYFRL